MSALSTAATINAHADPPSSPPPPLQSTAWKVRHYRGRRHLVLRAGITASMEGLSPPPRPVAKITFERRSIQSWLDGGHLTCPVTNLPLPPSPPLIPNHALRRLIAAVSPSAAASLVPAEGGAHARQEAVSAAVPTRPASPMPALLGLAKSSATGRREVLESGNAAVLLRQAKVGDEAVARALLHLSLDGNDTRVGLVANGAVDALSAVVSRAERRRRPRPWR
jgi:hypothetical protein|uniref:U-box domain-containing protein n=1 Tax=Zea mays TaxID=4577 RepID=A0A804LZ64_MAIZE